MEEVRQTLWHRRYYYNLCTLVATGSRPNCKREYHRGSHEQLCSWLGEG